MMPVTGLLRRLTCLAPARNISRFHHCVDWQSTLKPGYMLTQRHFSTTQHRPSNLDHDHTKLWTAERALSAALLGVMPAALMFPSQSMDVLLAVTLVMHNHWGIEANVVDYVRPIIFGPVIPKIAQLGVYALSVVTLAGLFYIVFNDVGIANAILMLWKM